MSRLTLNLHGSAEAAPPSSAISVSTSGGLVLTSWIEPSDDFTSFDAGENVFLEKSSPFSRDDLERMLGPPRMGDAAQ